MAKEIRLRWFGKRNPMFPNPTFGVEQKGWKELSWTKPASVDSSFLLKEPGWSQHRGNLELFTRL